MIRLAREYADLADDLLDDAEGDPHLPALTLYREAILLLMADSWSRKRALAIRFEAAPESFFQEMSEAQATPAGVGDPSGTDHLSALHGLVAVGELATPEQHRLAEVTRRSVRRLLGLTTQARLARIIRRRRSRTFCAASLTLACLTGLGWGAHRLFVTPNLAAGKPWHVSSQIRAPYSANVLFHTSQEDNPWFEVDLGSRVTIRALQVTNRRDSNQDRSIPLIAEVSEDRSAWREVARQQTPFSVWEPGFSPTKARYVRLRVPRVTMLHLESVKVF